MTERNRIKSKTRPPFCPNPNCRYHSSFRDLWPVKKHGFYYRQVKPQRIQRYQCLACKRAFSSQTFHPTYWLKRPDVLAALFMKTVGAMANRQIARDLRVSPSTVDLQLSRLGRHCLLFHHFLSRSNPIAGPLVIDGFETFEFSQYYPFHFNVAVEADTGFFRYFTDSELRRKGRMRPEQKRRRQVLETRLGRPHPKAVEYGIFELLSVSLKGRKSATLRRDNHPAYSRAIRRLSVRVQEQITPSIQRRGADNPLFEVNLLDLLIRHSSANHRRETIAWSKRRQRAAERLAILLVWRNYVKRRGEKGPAVTPGMLKGLTERPLAVREILKERLFPTRVSLPDRWRNYYWGRVSTRPLENNRLHELKYAA
jgi:transposase-like protein